MNLRAKIATRFGAWQNDRRAAVLAGVLLLLVPTLFTVFATWSSWSAWIRISIMVAWGLAAVFVVTGTARQNEHIQNLVGEPRKRRKQQRILAGGTLIPALLTSSFTRPGYQLRLFLYDRDLRRLLPSYEPPTSLGPSKGWEIGQGVTGKAWERKDYVIARGNQLTDPMYRLTQEQEERNADLQVVAAMPVANARGRMIAVLTASSTEDDGWLASDEGWVQHSGLADVVARVLVDVLKVARD